MATATPSAIGDDLVARLAAALPDMGVVYGPPESVPAAPAIWVRYGPVSYEWGMFSVPHPVVTITVAVPRKGVYPSEYRYVTDRAQLVAQALSGAILLAGQAPITGLTISEASGVNYGGVPDALMAATITIELEDKEGNL